MLYIVGVTMEYIYFVYAFVMIVNNHGRGHHGSKIYVGNTHKL